MTTFKIVLAYDGSQFVGWQRQADGTSIQGLLEDALRELDQRDVAVIGAGRTDAGVHALGQVAGFSRERARRSHSWGQCTIARRGARVIGCKGVAGLSRALRSAQQDLPLPHLER